MKVILRFTTKQVKLRKDNYCGQCNVSLSKGETHTRVYKSDSFITRFAGYYHENCWNNCDKSKITIGKN